MFKSFDFVKLPGGGYKCTSCDLFFKQYGDMYKHKEWTFPPKFPLIHDKSIEVKPCKHTNFKEPVQHKKETTADRSS